MTVHERSRYLHAVDNVSDEILEVSRPSTGAVPFFSLELDEEELVPQVDG